MRSVALEKDAFALEMNVNALGTVANALGPEAIVIETNASNVTDEITSQLPSGIPQPLVDVALAIVILIVGWYLSKLVVRIAGRTVARRIERPSVTRTVLRAVRASVLLLAFFAAAPLLGLGSLEILLSVTVFSAVIGIVLAPLIGSFINGIFILTDRPFEIGDMIEVTDEGHRGFVEDITIRYTKIFTLENTFIVIPNSEIHTRDVINYSAEDERTREPIEFEITYESDVEKARRISVQAARNVDAVISGGPDIRIGSARYGAAPTCDIVEFGDHGIHLKVRVWIKEPYRLTIARSDVQAKIRERFEADPDIEFAYPHTHHVFDDTSGIARVHMGTEAETESTEDLGPPTENGVAGDQ